MQRPLTWLIAYPHAGQQPLWQEKPWWIAVVAPVLLLALATSLSVVVVNLGGYFWIALPLLWLLHINAARTFQIHIGHQGIHEEFSGNSRIDRAVVETLTALAVVQDYDGYKADHDGVHHPRLASAEDPDRQFTIGIIGIRPGASVRANKIRFLLALISPRIHGLFSLGRLRANFVDAPRYRRMMAMIWFATVIAVVAVTHQWTALMLGFVLPLSVLFQVSSIAQFVTEHHWAKQRPAGVSAKEHHLSLLINRHLGDPLPPREAIGWAWFAGWSLWWVRLLLYHLPARLGVLMADLPVHGSHHLWPKDKGWANAIYAYRLLADQSGKCPTEIVGGYFAILDFALEAFRAAPPATPDERPLTLAEKLNVTNGM